MDSEICVIGGGPSGSLIARRLAELGHRVCLVERSACPRPHVGESLLPTILPILDGLGMTEKVLNAGFLRGAKSIVRWHQAQDRNEANFTPPGIQVDRARFDAILLDATIRAGVSVLTGANASRPLRIRDGWAIPVTVAGRRFKIAARFVVDATGRRCLLGGHRTPCANGLMALYAYWRDTDLTDITTKIEAGPKQWYWSTRLPNRLTNVMVFVDRGCVQRLCAGSIKRVYRSLLAESTLFGHLDGRMIGPVRVCDASSYVVGTTIDEHSIRVGEASFAIDPLTSHGVQVAMLSALQGAIVVHTILVKRENRAAAIEFFQSWQKECSSSHASRVATLYASQASVQPSDFWIQRSTASAGRQTVDETRMAHTFSMTGNLRIGLSIDAGLQDVPVIDDVYVVRKRALTHPSLARPVAFLAGIPVAPLLAVVGHDIQVCDLLRAWETQMPREQGESVLRWMLSKRILVERLRGQSGP